MRAPERWPAAAVGPDLLCRLADQLPGYALGVLTAVEGAEVALHLPHCALCRVALARLDGVAELLPLSAAERTPPPRLRRRLLDAWRAEIPSPIPS